MAHARAARRTAALGAGLAIVLALAACSGGDTPEPETPEDEAAVDEAAVDEAADDGADDGANNDAADDDGGGPIAVITIGSERYETTPFCVQDEHLSVRGTQTADGLTVVVFGSFGIEDAADLVTLVVTGFDDAGTQDSWSVSAATSTDDPVGTFGDYTFEIDAGTASGAADFQFSRVTPGAGEAEESIESGSFEFQC